MDVQVTYALTQPDAPPGEMRLAFHAGMGVWRIDPPTVGGAAPIYILAQRGTDRGVMVMESRRAWLELGPGGFTRELEVSLGSGRAVRQGNSRVINTPCTVWRLPEPALGVACISARGVLLRRETPNGAVMEATSIELREQEPDRFVPPANYREITPAEMFAAPR